MLAEARARFDALGAAATPPARFEELRPDPLRIPPNAATPCQSRCRQASTSCNQVCAAAFSKRDGGR